MECGFKRHDGPRRVRQLDEAFLFGHERIVANPHRTHFGVTSELAVTRPELWETKDFSASHAR